MEPDLKDALKFVGGRVHHAFADAIEFRDDLPLPLGPPATGLGVSGPPNWAHSCSTSLELTVCLGTRPDEPLGKRVK